MARATGATGKVLLKQEATYGVAPTGSYTRMPFRSFILGAKQSRETSTILGLGRKPGPSQAGLITVDGTAKVPLDLRYVGYWLKGVLGSVTTIDTGQGFTHTFTPADELPSFAVEVGHPRIGSYGMNTGVAVGSLALGWGATQIAADVDLSFIGQAETVATSSAGGTPYTHALRLFSQAEGSVRKGGVTLASISSADLKIDNGVESVRTIRDDGKIDGVEAGVCTVTGKMVVKFADLALYDLAIAGDPIDIELAFTTSNAAKLTFALPAIYLDRPQKGLTNPGVVELPFEFKAADAGDGIPVVTATLINDVSTY